MKISVRFLALSLLFVSHSAYANGSSPLAALSDAEKSYYAKVFDYTMDTIKSGEKYDWASYSGKGSINVEKTFVSKSGAVCRPFNEAFNVGGHEGIDKGVGCKRRGKDGWCKLDLGKEAKTCALEDSPRMFGGVNVNLPGANVPPINMPPGGGLNAPAGQAPNVKPNVDTGSKKEVTGKSYADTVTGTAGDAAGPAVAHGMSWFSETFLR
jgi:hypothetical protein